MKPSELHIGTSGWLNDDKKVWVFFNNDYHGYAVKYAEKLKELVNLF